MGDRIDVHNLELPLLRPSDELGTVPVTRKMRDNAGVLTPDVGIFAYMRFTSTEEGSTAVFVG